MSVTVKPQSIRLRMLQEAYKHKDVLSIRMPRFFLLPSDEINQNWQDTIQLLVDRVFHEVKDFDNNLIFVHPCPVDEYYTPHLSFAGVFTSYKPRRIFSIKENIRYGITKVLKQEESKYSRYYYSRHSLSKSNQLGITFTALLDNACMFGTGYGYKERCLIEYFDSPSAMLLNDPKRLVIDSNKKLKDDEKRIVDSIRAVYEYFQTPVDIEFIINRRGDVYIMQIRPISPIHCKNYHAATTATWQEVQHCAPPSNILNTIGEVTGYVVDFRKRKPDYQDSLDCEEKIYCINHHPTEKGTSTLDFLAFIDQYHLSSIRLLIDHGKYRINNHLQYIIFEDPGIFFAANTTELADDIDTRKISVNSSGFFINITT